LLYRVDKNIASNSVKDKELQLALQILDMIALFEPNDLARGKELAKRYCSIARIYAHAALKEKISGEKDKLLFNSEKLYRLAVKCAPEWYWPTSQTAEFLYTLKSSQKQAEAMMQKVMLDFPDSIELRQELAAFYLRGDLRYSKTGEILASSPQKALPIIIEAVRLSDRHNPQVLEQYAQVLLANGNIDEAWKINAEARALEETSSLRAQHELIRQRRIMEENKQRGK